MLKDQAYCPQGLKVTSTPKVYYLCLVFHWRDLVAHTHFAYVICVHSLHMSHYTLALCCCILLCVYVSCNSFPEYVRKRPRLHDNVLGFTRRPLMENALGFSLVSPSLVNRRLWSAAWPPNRNRRSDLMHLLSRVVFCGLIGGYETAEWNRRMKPPFSPLFSGWILRLWSAAWPQNETAELDILGRFLSRAQFCGHILRPRPQNETADCAFQGQNCLFTCPVSWCYKYHTFSFL